jgi:Na+-translocating ferredoxin:NAD+ oxidoreductase RnfC subunit
MEDLVSAVRDAGVVGAGGAGFPTHVKLGGGCESVLVNGAECEPLLEVDQQLMALYPSRVLEALDAVVRSLGAREGIIGIKDKYREALEALGGEIGGFPSLRLHVLPNVYPAGDEQVLVYEATGRIVPEGGIPLEVGVVVLNVETLLNIWGAMRGIPVTEKYLTVCGEVHRPATVRVPLGVSFGEVIAAVGGSPLKDFVVIDGGPMMGRVVRRMDEPVTKTTKGLIVLPPDHPLVVSKERDMRSMMSLAKTACCHCMLCTDLCPRYLLGHQLRPDKLMRLAAYNDTCEGDAAATEAFLCCECGMCEVACVMGLQPWKLNRELKSRMGRMGIRNPHREAPKEVNPFRSFRGFPTPKLLGRLGLSRYGGVHAPMGEVEVQPRRLVLKLKQHIGAPSVPVVAPGKRVARGELLARLGGNVSANLHAPLGGLVESVGEDLLVLRVSDDLGGVEA